MTDRKIGRNPDGTFAPGNRGKPKGTRHKATMAALALLDGEGERLTRRAVELAPDGDVTALKLCLERIVPPRKDRPVQFALPPMQTARDAAMAARGGAGRLRNRATDDKRRGGNHGPCQKLRAHAGSVRTRKPHRSLGKRTAAMTALERRLARLEAARRRVPDAASMAAFAEVAQMLDRLARWKATGDDTAQTEIEALAAILDAGR